MKCDNMKAGSSPWSKGREVRRYLARVFIALCVIGIGVGYLGNYLSILPWDHFTVFVPGWFAACVMVLALWALIKGPFSWFWMILFLGGTAWLLSQWEVFPFKTLVAILLCVLVILLGIRMLLNPLFRRLRRRRIMRHVNRCIGSRVDTIEGGDGATSYHVTFGERKVDMTDQVFNSATISASFGELTLDLRGALVQDCSVIDARCSFGEISIMLPADVRIEVHSSGAFQSVENKHTAPVDATAPVVYINAECSFGEVRIH